jgi:hypothetical protein
LVEDKGNVMTQSEIDIINTCIAAIDSYHAWNTDRMTWLAITPDEYYKDAKELLEIDRTAKIIEMNEVMKDNGFVHADGTGSVAEFEVYYKTAAFEEFKRCYPMSGECDKCGQDTITNQPCVVRFNENACVFKPFAVSINSIILEAYKFYCLGVYDVDLQEYFAGKSTKERLIGKCQEGHGFYVLLADCTQSPFNLRWRCQQ